MFIYLGKDLKKYSKNKLSELNFNNGSSIEIINNDIIRPGKIMNIIVENEIMTTFYLIVKKEH